MIAKFFIGVLCLLSPVSMAVADDSLSVGTVTSIEASSGSALADIKNGNTTNPAGKNSPLTKGDHLITGANTSAAISLTDDTTIIIGPKSDFAIDSVAAGEQKATSLQLAYGLIHLMVNKIYGTDKSFVLHNGNSVMGVRGTEFVAEQGENHGNSVCHTLNGTVLMAASVAGLGDKSKSVSLTAGTTSQMTNGARLPAAATPFEPKQFLAALAKRAPSMASIRAKIAAKASGPRARKVNTKTEEKPREVTPANRPRRHTR